MAKQAFIDYFLGMAGGPRQAGRVQRVISQDEYAALGTTIAARMSGRERARPTGNRQRTPAARPGRATSYAEPTREAHR
jgi:hypothetical protein